MENPTPPLVPPPIPAPAPPPPPTPALDSGSANNPHHPFQNSQFLRSSRFWILLSIPFSLAIIGYIIYFNISNRGGIIISDNDTSNLQVSVNDRIVQPSKQGNVLFLSEYPGQYRLTLSKPNFLPVTQDISLKKGETITIRPAFVLLPKGDHAANPSSTVDYVRPSLDQKSLYYLGDNKQYIYRLSVVDRVPVRLTELPLANVSDIQWSGEPDIALLTQPGQVILQEIPKFDFHTQNRVKIGGDEIESPIWDPTNPNRIAFAYNTKLGEHSLVFSDKTGTKLDRKVQDISAIGKPKLIWSPDSSYILLLDRSTNPKQNNLWEYVTAEGSFKQLTQDGNVQDASFSPGATSIVYESTDPSSSSPLSPTLTAIAVDGTGKTPIPLHAHVSQVAWKDDTSFYLPEYQRNKLILQTIGGKSEDLYFSFPDPAQVRGMFYFSTSKTLIFYTSNSIYTVSLGG